MGEIETIDLERIKITNFFSIEKDTPLYLKIREELVHKGKDPVAGSKFEENTRKYRHRSTNKFLKGLQDDNYGALVMYDDSYLYGYAAYQRQGNKMDEMHIFKLAIDEKAKGHLGLIRKLIGESLSYARKKGIKKIVFDRDSRELIEFLKRREGNFGISINLEENSLRFVPLETGRF